jgi:hypothetical protein
VSAERFRQLFRQLGGDAYLNPRGDVVVDAPPLLFAETRRHVDEIDTRELARALQDKLELADARLRARGLEAHVDEHQPVGLR